MGNEYTDRIEEKTDEAYDVAEAARAQNKDPEQSVDVPVAEDLPAKAEGLVTADQFPELEGCGIKQRIRELEDMHGKNEERVALEIGKEIAQEEFYEFEDLETAIEAGLRIGLAYMTGGIVTAPLEGVAEVKLRDNDDGSQYLAVYYSGPIRSAGGTASAMSVLLADYIRKEVGIDEYKTRDQEIERYATEVEDYFSRVTKKQYTPERRETKMIAENVPVEVTGTPTEDLDVSNYKDLPRVHTNRIRGGMCLVYLDGLPLKASKIKKRIKNYGEEMGLEHWKWVEEYLELQHEIHSSGDEEEEEGEKHYEPNDKYISNITGGRPVFAHPGRVGGFRLRYGRSRTAGLAACSFHPAATALTDDFMALGTQLKTEYPGKASMVTPCDSIAPPIVRLDDGTVMKVHTREKAKELQGSIDKVLFLGDVLVPYGEFLENGKDLLPSPYVEEWWAQEVEQAIADQDADIDVAEYIEKPYPEPEVHKAFAISRKLDVPLHPAYTFFWDNISPDELEHLHEALRESEEDGVLDERAKTALEELWIEHEVHEGDVNFDSDLHYVLDQLLQPDETDAEQFKANIHDELEEVSGIAVREKAPIFLGNRMGRPEKAEIRTLKGDPMLLFPCGREEGGRMRNLMETYKEGKVTSEIVNNFCPECERTIHYSFCPYCGADEVQKLYKCRECDATTQEETHCGQETTHSWYEDVNVKELMDMALDNLDIRDKPELLKSPRGVTGKHKHVEPIEKGLIREKHGLYVNKDGTIRYDAVDVPITHFKPKEINVSIERLKEVGYTHDKDGEPLEDEDQVVELKYQDIIIPDGLENNMSASDYMLKVANFVDDLLEDFYGLEPYYDVETKEDLVGSLVVGLAPHTSGGVVGRIIGFTEAKGIYAHPFWHAAKRRNCDGDEDSIMMLMDALLNFSRQFLPDQRGTRTMDAPLILSTVLLPDEVDDESWNVDVVDQYPVEFYEATHEMKGPWEVDIKIAEDMIDETSGFKYTHETSDIRDTATQSAYVTLGDMSEKVTAQLDLGERISAVDENHVAELIIDKHFIRDIKGNLRAFSKQRMRCVNCNEKFRRVPLKGRCTECGQKLLLTVSEGAIKKYLHPSEDIADKYAISPYLRQQIMILKENIQSLFGKDDRQSGLDQFIED